MQKQNIALWCAITAAGIAGLAGCAGQASHIETSKADGSENRTTGLEGQASTEAAAGPVVKSVEDFRKVRFREAFRGLEITDGLIVVNRDAARDLAVGNAADAIARGDAKLAQNIFSGAVSEYRLALLADATSAEAYTRLGTALLGKRNDEYALAAFRTAVMHAPEDLAVRMMFAETINRTGDLKGWAGELENILALDPEHGEAHARLAVARHYLGDRKAALREIALADRFGGNVPPQLRVMLNN